MLPLAQAWPTKPIRMVVTFPSGGAPDILARLFADKAQLGQPVVVDNKPGAGGNIGADNVAKSPPDGYSLVMGTVGTHSINGALYSKMPYDMVKDFTPVGHVASAPNLLVVTNALPVKNVAELISYMKANPNKLSFGSPGIGTSVHVSGELFKSLTGTTMQHVPYKGRQFAIPDLVGGQIQVMFDNMPSALPMAKEGKIRALARPRPSVRRPRPTCPRWPNRARLRGHHLVRGVRARGHAARHRAEGERRDAARVCAARRAGQDEDPGPGRPGWDRPRTWPGCRRPRSPSGPRW
jgi:tripartite-type tricarboxylate transporter receptor subunit TctC